MQERSSTQGSAALISLAWLPAALPVLGAAVKALAGRNAEHGLERDLRRHSKLVIDLPPEADKTALLRLVNAESQAISKRSETRLYRKLDGGSVALAIVILVLSTALVWFLWWVDLERHWLEIVLRVLAVIVGGTGFLLATVGGLTNLWKDERPEPEEPGAAT